MKLLESWAEDSCFPVKYERFSEHFNNLLTFTINASNYAQNILSVFSHVGNVKLEMQTRYFILLLYIYIYIFSHNQHKILL